MDLVRVSRLGSTVSVRPRDGRCSSCSRERSVSVFPPVWPKQPSQKWPDAPLRKLRRCGTPLRPPTRAFSLGLRGADPIPDVTQALVFRPLMLSHPLEDSDRAALDLAAYWAEWKWD